MIGSVTLCVHRLVTTDDRELPAFEECFYSNKRRNRPPRGPEKSYPEIWDSLSMYTSAQGAQNQYMLIAERMRRSGRQPRLGPYVARLCLPGDSGFAYRDTRDPTGHVSVWGEPLDLVARIEDIFLADPGQQPAGSA